MVSPGNDVCFWQHPLHHTLQISRRSDKGKNRLQWRKSGLLSSSSATSLLSARLIVSLICVSAGSVPVRDGNRSRTPPVPSLRQPQDRLRDFISSKQDDARRGSIGLIFERVMPKLTFRDVVLVSGIMGTVVGGVLSSLMSVVTIRELLVAFVSVPGETFESRASASSLVAFWFIGSRYAFSFNIRDGTSKVDRWIPTLLAGLTCVKYLSEFFAACRTRARSSTC